jgi:hypothetical protein
MQLRSAVLERRSVNAMSETDDDKDRVAVSPGAMEGSQPK